MKLGEEFDSNVWLNRKEFDYLLNYITRISSGNVALAGPRGVGKTSLMKAVRDHCRAKKYVTQELSTPTRYDEKEFVLNLFESVCDATLDRIAVDLKLKKLAMPRTFNQMYTWKDRLRPVALIGGGLYLIVILLQAGQVAAYLDSMFRLWYYGNLLEKVAFVSLVIFLTLPVIALLWAISPVFRPTLIERMQALDANLASLYQLTLRCLEQIRYQQTYQSAGNVEFAISSVFKIGSTLDQSLTRQPYTLVGLIADYRKYITEVTKQFGKVIICIDELDKVLDPDQAREFLRKIKGVFSLENSYYIVSVSEEALEAFELRNLVGKDEVDSTFTTVIRLRNLSVAQCRQLLEKRGVKEQDLDMVLAVLSSGNPRDLIRLARDLFTLADPVGINRVSLVEQEMQQAIKEVIDGIRDERNMRDTLKFDVCNRLSVLPDPSQALPTIQELIDSLSQEQDHMANWLCEVLTRLGVRLNILTHLAKHPNVFSDESLCDRYQEALALIPRSPLEAQKLFIDDLQTRVLAG